MASALADKVKRVRFISDELSKFDDCVNHWLYRYLGGLVQHRGRAQRHRLSRAKETHFWRAEEQLLQLDAAQLGQEVDEFPGVHGLNGGRESLLQVSQGESGPLHRVTQNCAEQTIQYTAIQGAVNS